MRESETSCCCSFFIPFINLKQPIRFSDRKIQDLQSLVLVAVKLNNLICSKKNNFIFLAQKLAFLSSICYFYQ